MTASDASIRFGLLELDEPAPRKSQNLVPAPDLAPDIPVEWAESEDTTPGVTMPVLESVDGLYKGAFQSFNTLDDVIHAIPELDSEVIKEPVYLDTGAMVPDAFATVRALPDGTKQALGIVGKRYHVIQDKEAFAIMRPLLDDGVIHNLTAGVYGAKSWLYGEGQKFQADIRPGDTIEARVLIGNSHDGSLTWSFGFPGNRVVCQNTFHMALSSDLSKLLKVRHTTSADAIVNQVKEAVSRFGYEFVELADKMQAMAKLKADESTVRDMVGYVFQPSKWADMEAEEQEESRLYQRVLENYYDGEGAAPGTVWGAYNATTEYLTHQRSRSDDANAQFADLQWGNGSLLSRRAWSWAENQL